MPGAPKLRISCGSFFLLVLSFSPAVLLFFSTPSSALSAFDRLLPAAGAGGASLEEALMVEPPDEADRDEADDLALIVLPPSFAPPLPALPLDRF